MRPGCHGDGDTAAPCLKRGIVDVSVPQISVLLPLMENRKLLIPGRDDCIEEAPGFQFFATRR